MNYIGEINAFERWLETHELGQMPQLLMYKFYKLANRAGWPEWLKADNLTLMAAMRCRREGSVIAWRRELEKNGLITCRRGARGGGNSYRITPLYVPGQKGESWGPAEIVVHAVQNREQAAAGGPQAADKTLMKQPPCGAGPTRENETRACPPYDGEPQRKRGEYKEPLPEPKTWEPHTPQQSLPNNRPKQAVENPKEKAEAGNGTTFRFAASSEAEAEALYIPYKQNRTEPYGTKNRPENSLFCAPTPAQVRQYCKSRGLQVDEVEFCAYYNVNGWRVGDEPMQSWQAVAQSWARRAAGYAAAGRNPFLEVLP